MTKQNRTTAADDLALEISAKIETARGLVLALENLTFASQELTETQKYNLVVNHFATGSVLQALSDELDLMQAAADQLEDLTTQLSRAARQDEGGEVQ